MVGDDGGAFERAAVLEVGGDARPEGVVADPGGNVGRLGTPLHHRVHPRGRPHMPVRDSQPAVKGGPAASPPGTGRPDTASTPATPPSL